MSKGKTEVPNPFPITDNLRGWARSAVPRLDLEYHTAEFVDYWLAHGKRMADWDATWRNWMRKAMDYKPRFKAEAIAPKDYPKVSDIFKNSGTMSREEALKKFSGP